jgi:DNA-binding MarR family transcriptional regulator
MWLAVSREQASRAISGLEEKGYVEKRRASSNWRNVEVTLTVSGRHFVDDMRKQTLSALKKALSVLSEEEASRLRFCSQQSALLLSEVVQQHGENIDALAE